MQFSGNNKGAYHNKKKSLFFTKIFLTSFGCCFIAPVFVVLWYKDE